MAGEFVEDVLVGPVDGGVVGFLADGHEVHLAGERELGPGNHRALGRGGEDFLVELGGQLGILAGAAQVPRGGEAVGGHGPVVGALLGGGAGGFEGEDGVLEFAEAVGGPAVADQGGDVAVAVGFLLAGGQAEGEQARQEDARELGCPVIHVE